VKKKKDRRGRKEIGGFDWRKRKMGNKGRG